MDLRETLSTQTGPELAPPNIPSRWDIGAITAALQAEPALASDVAHGAGASWRLGRERSEQTELAIFPEAGVVRVTSEADGVQVTLFRQHHPPTIEPGDIIVFELPSTPERRSLAVGPNGSATLCFEPDPTKGPETAPTSADAAKRPKTPFAYQPRPEGHPGAAAQVSGERSAANEKRPYLSLSGTLVAAPTYRVTKAGKRVAELLLELPEERLIGQTQTSLVKAVAFGDLADRVRDRIQAGMRTTCNGYLHDVEFTKDGHRIREDQLWLAAIIRGDGTKQQP